MKEDVQEDEEEEEEEVEDASTPPGWIHPGGVVGNLSKKGSIREHPATPEIPHEKKSTRDGNSTRDSFVPGMKKRIHRAEDSSARGQESIPHGLQLSFARCSLIEPLLERFPTTTPPPEGLNASLRTRMNTRGRGRESI